MKILRQRAFLTQRELAQRAGLSEVTVNRLEQGKQTARISTIRKLASALGVVPEELV
ncbi:MAG TPA: helix-turn-helix transcriptional regulator [Dehalococcoidia bacterium]|nr:helix-turn-helix transcriptional regulator [Dehalococcoidia bacterium]HLF08854.1 helix-turn-helix transcriptional regulator [Dehalococcoidia bacterium]